jgi:hypothetical protein
MALSALQLDITSALAALPIHYKGENEEQVILDSFEEFVNRVKVFES